MGVGSISVMDNCGARDDSYMYSSISGNGEKIMATKKTTKKQTVKEDIPEQEEVVTESTHTPIPQVLDSENLLHISYMFENHYRGNSAMFNREFKHLLISRFGFIPGNVFKKYKEQYGVK